MGCLLRKMTVFRVSMTEHGGIFSVHSGMKVSESSTIVMSGFSLTASINKLLILKIAISMTFSADSLGLS